MPAVPFDPTRQLFDAAVREVVARAAQPSDVNRLVAAAVRLRSAHLALRADQPSPAEPVSLDVRTAERGVLAAAAELAGGRASQNRVIEAHEALVAARTDSTPTEPVCDFAAWCDGSCPDDFEPDVRGTRRDILHTHRWALSGGPLERVQLGQIELPPEVTVRPGDADVVVWLDHRDAQQLDTLELTVDQAADLAGALAEAVRAARGADQ